MILGEHWNELLEPANHSHKVGDGTNRARCYNCILSEAGGEMGRFETAALDWYHDNVNHFTVDTGSVPSLISDLALKGMPRTLFLKAMDKIYLTKKRISVEKQEIAAAAAAGNHG